MTLAPSHSLAPWAASRSLLLAILVPLGRQPILTAQLTEPYKVPSDAMAPTLRVGDFVHVNHRFQTRPVPLPAVGAIVLFKSGEGENLKVVKRVIGLPHDTLAMRSDTLVRNGRPVPEPYVMHTDGQTTEPPRLQEQMRAWQLAYVVGPRPKSYEPDRHTWGPIAIPQNVVFVLGDNRENSYDSRYFGFVALDSLIGEVLEIYWSWDDSTHRARADRIGTRPH